MKKVKLDLVGVNGNAFSVLGAFQQQAKKENWKEEEITKVIEKATSGNYDHLLQTIMEHCE